MLNCSYVAEQLILPLDYPSECSSSENVSQQGSNTLPRQDAQPYDDMSSQPASCHYKKPVVLLLPIE